MQRYINIIYNISCGDIMESKAYPLKLDGVDWQKLYEIKKITGIPVCWQINEAVKQYLERSPHLKVKE